MQLRDKSYFINLTRQFGLNPNHHNLHDLINMCDLNNLPKEADFLRKKLASSGEVTSSVFIAPFLDMVFTPKSDTEVMRETCDDEYAKLPPENESPPVKFHPPRKIREWTLRELQDSHREWVEHNFPEQLTDPTRADDGFYGLVEEVGELARALLKARQGIRGTPEFWREQQLDAVGDIVIFLTSWCTTHDIDLQYVVEKTWADVSKRDWKKYPETGIPN